MKSRVTVLVLSLTVLIGLAGAGLVGCGGSGDPYTGHWTGSKQGTIVITASHAGWWTVRTESAGRGLSPLTWAAVVNGELQTTDGGWTFQPSGGKLKLTVEDLPPETLTRQ